MSELVLVALLLVSWSSAMAQVVGAVMPSWTPGTLDIHQISTGRGNSALLIFPDGTTLLVDAGALKPEVTPHSEPPHPDGSRAPGEWIARYVRHMLAYNATPQLDYALITHLHNDHMGYVGPGTKMAKNGRYRSSGITEVAEYIPIRNLLDRAWPDYNWPEPIHDEWVKNYRTFLEWQSQHNGLRAERFLPGRKDQITPLRSPAAYPTFQVRNIAANGEVWTGVADETRQHFPPVDPKSRDLPSENSCSTALRVSYGKFDYFTAGDMTSFKDEGEPPWHNIERPVALATGPVDVLLLNHHGYYDANSFFFISVLQPRVAVIPIWSAAQPDRHVLRRLLFNDAYAGPRDVFATAMTPASRVIFSDWTAKMKALDGHIVVRVAPGGATYRVFVLDNSNESFKVMAVHGPYESR